MHQLELITFLKISGEIDITNLKMTSLDQFLKTNGAEIWTEHSMTETMMIGAMLRMVSHTRHQPTTQIRMESKQRSQLLQKQNMLMESQSLTQHNSTNSQMETEKSEKLKTMEKAMSPLKFTILRKVMLFQLKIDLV